ncbi:MAG: hypothetical protein ACI8RD_009693, partial [Bacillariaceae sp.]|jgi:hypothetical protein
VITMRLPRLKRRSGTKASKECAQEKEKNAKLLAVGINNSVPSSSLTTNITSNTTGKSNTTLIEQKETKSKPDVTTTTTTTPTKKTETTKISPKQPENDRQCFTFQDNDDEDDDDDDDEDDNYRRIIIRKTVKIPRTTRKSNTPPSKLNIITSTSPKNFFHPPQEVTVDHLFVPPSPMKEPSMTNHHVTSPQNERLLDDHPGLRLTFDNTHDDEHHCFGDPVGDIAMHRQLLDAQRLVRVILEPSHEKNQQLLDTNTILHAIRSHALMKRELIELRKKQEVIDGDPPCILQNLGSPTATTLGGSPTSTNFHNRLGSSIDNSICASSEKQMGDAPVINSDNNSAALENATSTIERLQKQLASANEIIHNLKEEMSKIIVPTTEGQQNEDNENKNDIPIETTCLSIEEQQLTKDQQEQQYVTYQKYTDLNGKYHQLVKNHETSLEESKRNLDNVLDEIACVPKEVLAKESVREKLELYCQTVTHHASEIQVIEMEETMRKSHDESERRIQELEIRIRLQEENHKKEIQAMQQSDGDDVPCFNYINNNTDTKENEEIMIKTLT